jgi:hypothetical protein
MSKDNNQDVEIVRLQGQVSFMKEQQDSFSREVLDTVKDTSKCVNTLNSSVQDIMSVLQDDKMTTRKGLISRMDINQLAIRDIQEGIRRQNRIWASVGAVAGAVATAAWGFFQWWNRQQ